VSESFSNCASIKLPIVDKGTTIHLEGRAVQTTLAGSASITNKPTPKIQRDWRQTRPWISLVPGHS